MQGDFSIKSDVYSFGVLVMEIISGKKNSSFYETGAAEDLVSYVSREKCKFFFSSIICYFFLYRDHILTIV